MLIGIDASRAARAQRTGTEHYAYQLIRHLLALDTPHRYRLYFQQPPPAGLFASERDARVESRVLAAPRLWTHLALGAEMRRRAPDALFVPAHVLPLTHPRRSVMTIHDLGYHDFPDAHTAAQRAYLHWSTRFAVRHAARLIAVSQATKADLVKLYGADAQRVCVVHHGVTHAPPQDDTALFERLRARFKVPARYIISIGTLQPRKNFARLIAAFAALQKPRDELALLIVGKQGWHAERLLAQAHAAGVTLTGHVNEDEKYALLRRATLFALPSLYEGFGMPLLEAQSCGVPVLTSNSSACPEVAGEGALFVDPHDTGAITHALRRLLDDAELRAVMRAKGYANLARFSWEQCARQTLQVIEQT